MKNKNKNIQSFLIWLGVPHLTCKLANKGNSAYFKIYNGAHHIIHKINLWELTWRGHLNTDAQARNRT